MAGIGFELRRLLRQESLWGLVRGYGYAGLISSGPWLVSMAGVMAVGLLGASGGEAGPGPFLGAVTYLMAFSLVLSGPVQLLLCRYVADRLFEGQEGQVVPNLLGALGLVTGVGLVAATSGVALLEGEPLCVRLLLVAAFVELCNLWVLVVVLSGVKAYKAVLGVFIGGQGLAVAAALGLRGWGLEGLLGAFVLGEGWMVVALLGLVLGRWRARGRVAWDFLRRGRCFPELAAVGLLYNLGLWVDELLFWFDPRTSQPVLGPLRTSPLYDVPMFLATLCMVPGMAVYLVRVETDFAERYEAFYAAVREGGRLEELEGLRNGMVEAVRQGLAELAKVQGLVLVLALCAEGWLVERLGLSAFHLPLFRVGLVAASAQVLLLAVLNVLFYLDKRRVALGLVAGLLVSNTLLTLLSKAWGVSAYGLGLAVAVLATALGGLAVLSRKLDRLEYETFMLQP